MEAPEYQLTVGVTRDGTLEWQLRSPDALLMTTPVAAPDAREGAKWADEQITTRGGTKMAWSHDPDNWSRPVGPFNIEDFEWEDFNDSRMGLVMSGALSYWGVTAAFRPSDDLVVVNKRLYEPYVVRHTPEGRVVIGLRRMVGQE